MQAEILIISNAPGELAAWVRPVVGEVRRRYPDARLTVALVPCPYASGHEADSLAAWNERLEVWKPRQTVRFILSGRTPDGRHLGPKGLVLFLGGDQIFGVMASRRTGYPLLVYTETIGRWPWAVDRYLLSDRTPYLAMRGRGTAPGKLALVGNLMVDSVKTRQSPAQTRTQLGLIDRHLVLGILPGSKPFKVFYATPFLLRVAEILREANPSLQVVLHQSPFTPLAQLDKAISTPSFAATTGGTTGRLHVRDGQVWIVTERGCPVRVVPPEYQYDGMAIDDLALTVPGTNTAELAVLGVPQVVVLPLNKPEEIPLEGLIGQVGRIPVLGKWLKRLAIGHLSRRIGLVALPNRRMGRMVTPEMIGVLSPEAVAGEAAAILGDPMRRRQIKLDLLQAMGYPGAAKAVSTVVSEVLSGMSAAPPGEVARPAQDAS